MAHPGMLWLIDESKWFDFYEKKLGWPWGTGSQRYSTAKIVFQSS
jgi:hypothetical protein